MEHVYDSSTLLNTHAQTTRSFISVFTMTHREKTQNILCETLTGRLTEWYSYC